MRCGFWSAALVAIISIAALPAYAQPRRPMEIKDLFDIQTLGDVRISPDGTSVAIVIQRAFSAPAAFRPYNMFGNDQADIWVMPDDGGPAKNITGGAKNGIGYWGPVWSPDGKHLALLSTAGGDNVRAYVWTKGSGMLQRLSDRGVDMGVGTEAAQIDYWTPMQWVDDRHLLVSVLPAGDQPSPFRIRRQTQVLASEAWKRAARGREPTSSVLEGGIAPDSVPAGQLLLVDVSTLRARVLVEGNIKRVLLSPDRQHVAVITQARRPVPAGGKLLGSAFAAPSQLGIISLRDGSSVRWIGGVLNLLGGFGQQPHRWSPSGSALAVLASERPEPGAPKTVFVVSMTDLAPRRISGDLAPAALAWSEGDQLLVRASADRQGERSDWWTVGVADEEPRNLTAALSAVPAELVRIARRDEVIGVADGAIWLFDVASKSHRNLIEPNGPRVTTIVWPADRATSSPAAVVVRAGEGGAALLLHVDLSGSAVRVSNFPQPARATMLAGYHPGRNLAVFAAPRDPDGSFLWTGKGGNSAFDQRLALNLHLAGVEGGERVLIDYRSSEGEDLKAILLLPAGYKQGTRYPLVTWVYPGMMYRDIESQVFWINKNQAHEDNLHILAGAGYAVLLPSMPSRENSRNLASLPIGVLPAIDRLVELGIADSDRVAVIGQSGGGYATYGLVTQTNRFKAAVAISGPSNLVTSYGTFSGETRYVNDIDEILPSGSEGYFGPPWVDPALYIRNSPLFFIDRVQTPLLILHGDIDYVPMQHAEEVFTGLARLGKRVRFVRYWGESHGAADSPANLRDRWQQILRWLDTYLRSAR